MILSNDSFQILVNLSLLELILSILGNVINSLLDIGVIIITSSLMIVSSLSSSSEFLRLSNIYRRSCIATHIGLNISNQVAQSSEVFTTVALLVNLVLSISCKDGITIILCRLESVSQLLSLDDTKYIGDELNLHVSNSVTITITGRITL